MGHLSRKKSVKGKIKKHESFYTRKSIVNNIFYTNKIMENSVDDFLLLDYVDVLPINGISIVNLTNSFAKMGNDENQQALP
jgi:hypothetical protein